MDKLRLRFEKTGKAIYISHLDLMRVIQRVFLRAEVPIKYSEGFNPHALISICLPLPVGSASVCELMDFRVSRDVELDTLPERLNRVSPAGLRFLEAYEPERRAAQIKWLRVEGRLQYDERDPEALIPRIMELLTREELFVIRRTKRGEGEFNLAPHLREPQLQVSGGELILSALISAQEPTINPELIISALTRHAPECAPDFAQFKRVETYDEALRVFR